MLAKVTKISFLVLISLILFILLPTISLAKGLFGNIGLLPLLFSDRTGTLSKKNATNRQSTPSERKSTVGGVAYNESVTIRADDQKLADEGLKMFNKVREEVYLLLLPESDLFYVTPEGKRVLGPEERPTTVYISYDKGAKKVIASTSIIDDPKRERHICWLSLPTQFDQEEFRCSFGHEVAHIVMANNFGELLPILDEGVAQYFDDLARRQLSRNKMKQIVQEYDRYFPSGVSPWLIKKEISITSATAYAIGDYFIQFLVEKGGGGEPGWEKLGEFLEESKVKNLETAPASEITLVLETALIKKYNLNFKQLNSEWKEWLFGLKEFKKFKPKTSPTKSKISPSTPSGFRAEWETDERGERRRLLYRIDSKK